MPVLRGKGRWLLIRALVRLTLLVAATTRVSGDDAAPPVGAIAGRVTAGPSGAPIAGALVTLSGGPAAAADPSPVGAALAQRTTGRDGGYVFEGIVPGDYRLVLRGEGFAPAALGGIRVSAGTTARADAALDPALTVRITVPADRGSEDATGPSRSLFTRARLEGRPASFGDPFRAIAGSAGIDAQNDFHSEVRIRGGDAADTAVLLDGLPLPCPYHFSGSGGSVAALNGDLIERAEVSTGGFSVEHGDALAGVVDLSTRDERPAHLSGRAGFSTLQAHAALSGPAGPGAWTLSGRQSDLGLYDGRVGEGGVEGVTFHDLFAGMRMPLPGSSRLDLELLADGSDFGQSLGGGDRGTMHGSQSGVRARFDAPLGGRAYLKVLLSQGERSARSSVTDGAYYDQAQRQRTLKASLLLLAGSAHHLATGVDLSGSRGSIAGTVAEGYALVPQALDDRASTAGLYLEDRWDPGDRLSLRYGARADRFAPTGETALSPRLAIRLRPLRPLALRAAAGRFVQFPRPEQSFLAAGEALRRQVADHYILGLEADLPGGAGVLVEAYLKDLRDPIGESINRYVELPELLTRFDRGVVRGLDVALHGPASGPWRLRLDYSYMVAREEKGGVTFPREADQRHVAGVALGRSLGRGFDLEALLRYGSGLPYTPQEPFADGIDYGTRLGVLNSGRLPAYARLDLRLGRSVSRPWGRLSCHLDLLNVTDRKNVRSVDLIYDAGSAAFYRVTRFQSPFLPVFGLTAEF